MKKILFSVFILSIFSSVYSASAQDIELVIKESQCTDEGIVVSYGLVNKRNFNRPNIRIGFKVIIDEKVAGCEEIKVDIPAESDGSKPYEVTVKAPCAGKTSRVVSKIFPAGLSRYKVEEWFFDCPE